MSAADKLTRRRLLAGAATAAGAALLSGCDDLSRSRGVREVLFTENDVTLATQRFLLSPSSLAREFPESEISEHFRANGSTDPADSKYRALAADGFADWRLEVGGLVTNPLSLSLADLRAMPARTQVTRHDCVEGWSCIGKWTGVQLAAVLDRAGLKPEARYVVFRCFDSLEQTLDGTGQYYESIGLEDAYHPQTILAYDMNGAPLAIPHGAPVRVRIERQLGYKMAKYIRRIDVVADFADISGGNGGFWEDRGYEWYAGI